MKIKKNISIIVFLLVFIFMPTSKTFAFNFPYNSIQVYVNDKPLQLSNEPVIKGGRTLIPARDIFEALGASVSWNGKTKIVTAKSKNAIIELQIDNTVAYVDGVSFNLDAPAQIIDNETFIPIRFISESLDADVFWDALSRVIFISTSDYHEMGNLFSGDFDIDGDGKNEKIYVDGDTGDKSAYLSIEDIILTIKDNLNNKTQAKIYLCSDISEPSVDIEFSDFNGDGLKEIMISLHTGGTNGYHDIQIYSYENNQLKPMGSEFNLPRCYAELIGENVVRVDSNVLDKYYLITVDKDYLFDDYYSLGRGPSWSYKDIDNDNIDELVMSYWGTLGVGNSYYKYDSSTDTFRFVDFDLESQYPYKMYTK